MSVDENSCQSVFLGFLKDFQNFYDYKFKYFDLNPEQKRAGVKLKKSGHIKFGVVYHHEESVAPLSSGKWQVQNNKGNADFTVKALDAKTEKRKIVISLERKRKDEIFFSYYEDGNDVELCILDEKVLDTKNDIDNISLLRKKFEKLLLILEELEE